MKQQKKTRIKFTISMNCQVEYIHNQVDIIGAISKQQIILYISWRWYNRHVLSHDHHNSSFIADALKNIIVKRTKNSDDLFFHSFTNKLANVLLIVFAFLPFPHNFEKCEERRKKFFYRHKKNCQKKYYSHFINVNDLRGRSQVTSNQTFNF